MFFKRKLLTGVVIDVRSPEEYALEHAPRAVNIPIDELTEEKIKEHACPYEDIIVYCHSGARATRAEQLLDSWGYINVYNLRELRIVMHYLQ
jgi:phage shock protein E